MDGNFQFFEQGIVKETDEACCCYQTKHRCEADRNTYEMTSTLIDERESFSFSKVNQLILFHCLLFVLIIFISLHFDIDRRMFRWRRLNRRLFRRRRLNSRLNRRRLNSHE